MSIGTENIWLPGHLLEFPGRYGPMMAVNGRMEEHMEVGRDCIFV